MSEIEAEIQRIDAGGDAWDELDEEVELTITEPLDRIVKVRLSAASWNELRRLAREGQEGPAKLAQTWILQRLGEPDPTKSSAPNAK